MLKYVWNVNFFSFPYSSLKASEAHQNCSISSRFAAPKLVLILLQLTVLDCCFNSVNQFAKKICMVGQQIGSSGWRKYSTFYFRPKNHPKVMVKKKQAVTLNPMSRPRDAVSPKNGSPVSVLGRAHKLTLRCHHMPLEAVFKESWVTSQ